MGMEFYIGVLGTFWGWTMVMAAHVVNTLKTKYTKNQPKLIVQFIMAHLCCVNCI